MKRHYYRWKRAFRAGWRAFHTEVTRQPPKPPASDQPLEDLIRDWPTSRLCESVFMLAQALAGDAPTQKQRESLTLMIRVLRERAAADAEAVKTQ